MDDQNKSSKFGLGVVVGSILGGLAAFFLSPGSGEENREAVMKEIKHLKKEIDDMEIEKKVKEIWGEVSEDGMKIYKQARKEVLKGLDEFEDKWEDFDKEKYMKMVGEVVEDMKVEMPKAAKHFEKLKDSFMQDWEEMSKKNPKKSKVKG